MDAVGRLLVELAANEELSALGILLFVSSWNEYFWPLLVYRNISYSVIQLGLQNLPSSIPFIRLFEGTSRRGGVPT